MVGFDEARLLRWLEGTVGPSGDDGSIGKQRRSDESLVGRFLPRLESFPSVGFREGASF